MYRAPCLLCSDRGGGHPRPRPRGCLTVGGAESSRRSVVISPPVVDVVVSTPRALLIAADGHRRRPVLPPAIHPANSGEKRPWELCFSLSFSSCSPFPPRKQLLAAAVRGAVVVSIRPCRSSSPCPLCEQGLAAVVWAQGCRLVVIPLPWAP